MKKIYLFILLLTFILPGYGDNYTGGDVPKRRKKKELKKTNLEFGVGITGSVLYLARNVKEDNDAKGYTFIANYGVNDLFRLSAQYTKFLPINIAPTWYDVTANSAEVNAEMIVMFKNNKTMLYPLAGLSYNTFKGYFTGANDYLNLRELYKANTTVSNKWFGVNVGTGMEHAFGPIVIFADYKMRVGKMEPKGINIMDVCYSGGIRIKLYVLTLKSVYHKFGDRYHWF
jgi:hypothetical protein